MRYIILAACLFGSGLMAERLGNLEYTLPEASQPWKVGNAFEGQGERSSKTVIYIPENTLPENMEEFFGVHVNSLPSEVVDKAALEKQLQPLLANAEVEVNIIEKDENSITYVWKSHRDVVFGLTRAFISKEGTALLSYEAEKQETLEARMEAILKAFREAHIVD